MHGAPRIHMVWRCSRKIPIITGAFSIGGRAAHGRFVRKFNMYNFQYYSIQKLEFLVPPENINRYDLAHNRPPERLSSPICPGWDQLFYLNFFFQIVLLRRFIWFSSEINSHQAVPAQTAARWCGNFVDVVAFPSLIFITNWYFATVSCVASMRS